MPDKEGCMMGDLFDELLSEVKREEQEEEKKRQEIIKNGCPHTHKTEHIGTITKQHFLVWDVCRKQFDLNGKPIE